MAKTYKTRSFFFVLGASISSVIYVALPQESENVKRAEIFESNSPVEVEETTISSEEEWSEDFSNESKFLLKDRGDIGQRDVFVAIWYAAERQKTAILEEALGDEFGPIYNKRSPVEILEERLKFWREFLDTSKKIRDADE